MEKNTCTDQFSVKVSGEMHEALELKIGWGSRTWIESSRFGEFSDQCMGPDTDRWDKLESQSFR